MALLCFVLLSGCATEWAAGQTGHPTIQPETTSLAQGDLKIQVQRSGIYRVTPADLNQFGLDLASCTPEELRLTNQGDVIPFWFDSEGPALYFYGQSSTDRYTAYATYHLQWGQGAGRVMQVLTAPPASGSPAVDVRNVRRFEENLLYVARAAPVVDEPWLWGRVAPGSSLAAAFEMPVITPGDSSVQVVLWGASSDSAIDPDHRVFVRINGESLGTVEWDGETVVEQRIQVPPAVLRKGQNEIELEAAGDTGALVDFAYLDRFQVEYQVPASHQDGELQLLGFQGSLVLEQAAWLFDVSDPAAPVVIEPQDSRSATGWQIDAEADMVALAAGGGLRPERLSPWLDSDWSDPSRQADMIVVAPRALVDSMAPWLAARRAQDIAVVVVPLEEIADEFGWGSATPAAINRFLRTAWETWQTPRPRFVLLVGDATYDYRDYLGVQPAAVVPSYLVPVVYGGETVSDSRLADVDGDLRPELAVGRWPVSSPAEVAGLVQRTLAYESASLASPAALFVADGSESSFAAATSRLIRSLGMDAAAVQLVGPTAEEVASAWNQDAWLVVYAGHGSLDLWGKTEIMSSARVPALQSVGRSPLVVQLTCLTGLFAHPEHQSLSEVLLLSPTGPVATISASSLTLPTEQEPFAAFLLQGLADPAVETVGEALLVAQQSPGFDHAGGQEIIDTFNLLGDPALRIGRPEETLE